ncbi:putative transposase (putative), gypsy type [Medicago truncatula]|uniref:Putative transposase (Putative), gypsy type n=1 Tax=Medicago truncatula TaxID=3880 RepID=A0A396JD25_MEDTR|nr:putative transposase (putative), gypsy type [Medicago truncatula]
MANEEAVALDSSWLGEEPLQMESDFSNDGVGEIPFGSIGDVEDWELMLPSTSDLVCSLYENHVFPMYEVVFKDMGFQLPFSEFPREMLRWTKLSPSHVHPNSYAFMRAFELLCDNLRLPASKYVLFSFFTVQRGTDWISFRQNQKMYEVFAGKVQSFKECFFLVRPRSATALDILFEAAKDGIQERRPFFPLCRSQDHFRYEPKNFEKMKDLGVYVNAAHKKIYAKKRRKNVQSLEHHIVGSGVGSSFGPVVDLEGEDPPEELVQESVKKQKVGTPSKQPVTPIRAFLIRSERGDFLQLPKVRSEPDQCGPHSTLFFYDSELRIIQNLGPAGRSKAIADGAIATMKALELAEEKASLEETLKKADLPREDEMEDTTVLRRADLVDTIGELEGSLVDVVKIGFDRAVAQLKVVNPDIDLNVEGIHPLSDVNDGVISPPPDPEEDNGHVDEAQA